MSTQWPLTTPREQIAELLTQTRREGAWYDLARLLALLMGEGLYSLPQARAEIGKMCGMSAGVVGRYVAAYRRILRIAEERGVPAEMLFSSSFNGCEVACRLYERSPNQGFESLVGLREERDSLATVRRRLRDAEAPAVSAATVRAEVMRRRGREIEVVQNALSVSAERLFGRGSTIRRRPGMRFFRRVGFEAVARDGSIVAGLDFLAPHPDQQRDELDVGFAASALLATYFRKFHYVTSPESGAEIAARAVETVAHFGLGWFGVMSVDRTGAIEVLRPARGGPDPDRTARYDALKAAYTIGRRSE